MSATDDFGRPPYDPSAHRGGGRGVAGVEATAETAEFPPIQGAPDGYPGHVGGGRGDEYDGEQPFVPLYEPPAQVASAVRHAPPPYAGPRPNGMPRGDAPAGMAPARDDRRGPGDPRAGEPRPNEQRPAEPWDSQSVGAPGDDFGARVQPHRQFLRGQDGAPARRGAPPDRPFPERPFQDRPGPDRPQQERPGMRPPGDLPHRSPQGPLPAPGPGPQGSGQQAPGPQPGYPPVGRDHVVPPPRTRNDAPPPARDLRAAPPYPQQPQRLAEPGPGDPRNGAPRRPPMVEPEPDRRGPDSPVRPLHDTAAYRMHQPAEPSAAPYDPAVGRQAPQHPEPPIPSQADLSATGQREQLRRRLPPQDALPPRDDSTWSVNDPEDPDLGPPPADLVPAAPREFVAEVRPPARAGEAAASAGKGSVGKGSVGPNGSVGTASGSFDVFSPRSPNGRRQADDPEAAAAAPERADDDASSPVEGHAAYASPPAAEVPQRPVTAPEAAGGRLSAAVPAPVRPAEPAAAAAPPSVPAPATPLAEPAPDARGGFGQDAAGVPSRDLPPAERPGAPAPRAAETPAEVGDDLVAPASGVAFVEPRRPVEAGPGTGGAMPAPAAVTPQDASPAGTAPDVAVRADDAPRTAPAPSGLSEPPVALPEQPQGHVPEARQAAAPPRVAASPTASVASDPAVAAPGRRPTAAPSTPPAAARPAEAVAFEAAADGFAGVGAVGDVDDEDDADDQMVVPWNNPAARQPDADDAAGEPVPAPERAVDAGPRPAPGPAPQPADAAPADPPQPAVRETEEPISRARTEAAGTGPSGAAGSRPAHGAPPPELTEPRAAHRAEPARGRSQHAAGDTGAPPAPAVPEAATAAAGPAPAVDAAVGGAAPAVEPAAVQQVQQVQQTRRAEAVETPIEATAAVREGPADDGQAVTEVAPALPQPARHAPAEPRAPAEAVAVAVAVAVDEAVVDEAAAASDLSTRAEPAGQRQQAARTESAVPAGRAEPSNQAAMVETVATQASVAPRNVTAHAVGEQASTEPGRGRRAVRRAEETAPAATGRAPAYAAADRDAVYRVIRERRDIGNDFLSDDIPDDVLTRVLESAHTAPSVGFAQPWDFIVLRSAEVRESVHELALRQRKEREATVPRRRRAKPDTASDADAIVRAPISVVVTCDPTRGGRSGSGTDDQARRAPYLAALAVENLWLAARAEGLGVDWLSFPDEREFAELLDLPDHLEIVAYLCLGYVREFTPASPALPESAEWGRRRPLAWAVHEEQYGRRALPGDEPMSLLSETTQAIRPLDAEACAQARQRHDRLAKPRGSLGVLEAVTVQIAGLTGTCPPLVPEPAAIAIFAGDHGVHAQGVAPRPQEATARSVISVLEGSGVVSAFAAQLGVDICVVDVGVATDLPEHDGLVPRKVRYGTGDFTEGAAMTRSEAVEAIEAGIETARDLVAAGNRCLLTGDLGVANSTVSSALLAAFTKASASQVTGYGTGIDEQAYAHKVDVVGHALRTHQPDPEDPVGVLAAVGGLEHAAIAGFVLGAAALRVPLILDGVTACAAALAAQALCPEAMTACVAGHRSAEPGHALALEALGVTPLADIELHTGEGAGAVLALPLVQSAVRALRDVALSEDVEADGDGSDGAANGTEER